MELMQMAYDYEDLNRAGLVWEILSKALVEINTQIEDTSEGASDPISAYVLPFVDLVDGVWVHLEEVAFELDLTMSRDCKTQQCNCVEEHPGVGTGRIPPDLQDILHLPNKQQ